MKEINLEEILNKYSIYLSPYVKEHLQLKAAISDLICKTLDLAAENAEVLRTADEILADNLGYTRIGRLVDEQSILQIKEWIK